MIDQQLDFTKVKYFSYYPESWIKFYKNDSYASVSFSFEDKRVGKRDKEEAPSTYVSEENLITFLLLLLLLFFRRKEKVT